MNATAEQLDREADELFAKANGLPSPNEDSDGVTDPENVDAKTTDAGNEDADSAAGHKPDGDKPAEKTPPPESKQDSDGVMEGLTVENAAERIRNAQARMHTATQEASGLRRQVESLTSEIETLRKQVEEAAAAPAQAADSAERTELSQDLKSAMEDYPEVVSPLVAEIESLRNMVLEIKGNNDVAQPKVNPEVDQDELAREAAARVAYENEILASHPDMVEIASSDEFRGWVLRQPPIVSQILYGIQGQPGTAGTASEIVKVLTDYKVATGRTKKLEAAREEAIPRTPKARSAPATDTKTFTRTQIANMSAAEYEKNEAAIDAALAAGAILNQ